MLGCVELALVQPHERRTRLETEALGSARALGDSVGEGLCLLELGRIESTRGRPADAIASLDRALIILRDTDDTAPQAKVCDALMAAWRKQGRPGLATFWGKQAVNYYQAIRGNIRQASTPTCRPAMRARIPMPTGTSETC